MYVYCIYVGLFILLTHVELNFLASVWTIVLWLQYNCSKCIWIPCCKCNTFLFVWGKYCGYQQHFRMHQTMQIKLINPHKPSWQNRFNLKKRGWATRRIQCDQGEQIFTHPVRPVSQKHYSLLFSNYEIHQEWHLYRAHYKGGYTLHSRPGVFHLWRN